MWYWSVIVWCAFYRALCLYTKNDNEQKIYIYFSLSIFRIAGCAGSTQTNFGWNFVVCVRSFKKPLKNMTEWAIASRLTKRCCVFCVDQKNWNIRSCVCIIEIPEKIKSIDLKLSTLRNKIDYYFVKCQITMLTCHFSSSTLMLKRKPRKQPMSEYTIFVKLFSNSTIRIEKWSEKATTSKIVNYQR